MDRPDRNKEQRKIIICLTIGLAAVAGGIWEFRKGGVAPSETDSQPTSAGTGAPRGTVAKVVPHLNAIIQRLQASSDPKVCRDQLDALRSQLQSMPPNTASAAIREFLDSKVDALTHLSFKVGPDGFLQASPSVRVFLLDYLAQVDRANAAAYAAKILTSTDSPDEWAVALRNYALENATPDGRSFLNQKLQTMLTHSPWVREPSEGFLEAFDVAVYVGGTNLIPALTSLVRMTDNTAAAHAAYLALDRLTISDATTTLSMLESDPDLMQGREETRANYFARADVREPAQRRLLEEYLLDPARSASELDKFAGLYPNANLMISHNLLTRPVTPDGATLLARDAEALRVTEQWLENARFSRVKPQLEIIRRRLKSFLQRANGSP